MTNPTNLRLLLRTGTAGDNIRPYRPRKPLSGLPGRDRAHAVVFGAGFGGIAAALRLRARGYRVTLLDRAPRLGGRAQVYERGGFRFDAGPTVITAPFLFDELFALFERDRRDYVELVPVEPWYRFLFPDGNRFDYGGTVQDTLAEIARISPRDCAGYERLLATSREIFDLAFTQLADQPFDRFRDMLRQLPNLIRLKSYRTVHGLVSRHIRHPYLQRAFCVHPLLVGGNPYDTTSIYSLIHFLERQWGIHFPLGGTGALVDALGRLLGEVGVEARLNTTVEEILIERGRAVGVRTDDGRSVRADWVVANADPPFVYRNLIPDQYRGKWSDRRIERLRYSMGLFVLYFGTRRRYPEVPHHTILLGDSFRELLRDTFHSHQLSPDPSLYLHRPTATDPVLAPAGHDGFYVLAPVPNLQGNIDWNEAGPWVRDRVLSILEERLLPDLRENLALDFYVTPEDFKHQYLSHHGTGFSIAPTLTQSAWFRFHNRSKEVSGLYFVGAGTHPGAGVPGVLSSAKVLDRLMPAPEQVR